MVRIRLRRVGRKKQPSYRIVVADARSPRDGRYIEIIGFYNPRTQPETMTLQEDRAFYWLQAGAQPSDAVRRILERLGTWGRFERLRQGESLETLLSEAEAEAATRAEVSPKTSYPAHQIAKPAKKAKAAEAEEAEVEEAGEVMAAEEPGEAEAAAVAEVAEVEAAETEEADTAEAEEAEETEAAAVAEVEEVEAAETAEADEPEEVDETEVVAEVQEAEKVEEIGDDEPEDDDTKAAEAD